MSVYNKFGAPATSALKPRPTSHRYYVVNKFKRAPQTKMVIPEPLIYITGSYYELQEQYLAIRPAFGLEEALTGAVWAAFGKNAMQVFAFFDGHLDAFYGLRGESSGSSLREFLNEMLEYRYQRAVLHRVV